MGIHMPRHNHPLVVWTPPRYMTAMWKLSLAFMGVATAAVAGMDHVIPKKSWSWVHSGSVAGWLAIILGAMVFADCCRGFFVDQGVVQRAETEAKIRRELGAFIVSLSELLKVPVGDIGAGVYVPVHHLFGESPTLRRVVRHRLVQNVSESTVRWG